MNDSLARPAVTTSDILDFLRDHPTFLQDHPEILDALIPARDRPVKGGVADFQSYMIERLKADKQKALDSTREIVENARSNMNNQQRIHAAVLHVLEADSFDDFIHCITMDLPALLNVDIAVFLVESDDSTDIPHIRHSGVRALPAGTIHSWMADKQVLLQDAISGIEAVYGGGATLVRSQILLRLDIAPDTHPAMLAFGSRHPDTFHDGQATDQILFLARVIERAFRSWMRPAA